MAFKALNHGTLERNVGLLGLLALLTVAIGGIVEIAPLFWIDSTIEKVKGVRLYTPLELAGRNIYIREGCYVCHSQMVRPFRDEVERYGHYSLAAESMYDHPFQWGSKRTGPDLARVGGRYSDEWHRTHLINPRDVVDDNLALADRFGLSIGFHLIAGEEVSAADAEAEGIDVSSGFRTKDGTIILMTECDLMEISLVTFQSCPTATVDEVRARPARPSSASPVPQPELLTLVRALTARVRSLSALRLPR